jgi:hypothetical protein
LAKEVLSRAWGAVAAGLSRRCQTAEKLESQAAALFSPAGAEGVSVVEPDEVRRSLRRRFLGTLTQTKEEAGFVEGLDLVVEETWRPSDVD